MGARPHITKVAFHVNRDKPCADAVRARLAAFARTVGLEVIKGLKGFKGLKGVRDFKGVDGVKGLKGPNDGLAVVVLGGDGTMLSAVHRYPGVPLLGLNLGSLGYLAAVEEPHFEDAVRALSRGEFVISRRTVLDTRGRQALNDVVVSHDVAGHALALELLVDGTRATGFSADGLIVSTPTGSTAYSLSAGGPVLLPDTRSFVVTPVCPHALSSRPLVVRDTVRLTVRTASSAVVYVDGVKAFRLPAGKEVEIAKADVTVPLVELPGYDPCEVLSRKLGWSGSAKITRSGRGGKP